MVRIAPKAPALRLCRSASSLTLIDAGVLSDLTRRRSGGGRIAKGKTHRLHHAEPRLHTGPLLAIQGRRAEFSSVDLCLAKEHNLI